MPLINLQEVKEYTIVLELNNWRIDVFKYDKYSVRLPIIK